MKQIKHINYLLILTILFTSSCSFLEGIKPARKTGFITYYQDNDYSNLFPFDYVWMKKENLDSNKIVNFSVKIIPLPMLDLSEWEKSKSLLIGSKEEYIESIKSISDYFNERLISNLKKEVKDKKGKLKIVNAHTNEDYRLEIAFTEIVFGHPLAYAGATSIPLPGITHLFDSTDSPYASIEARIINIGEVEIVSAFSDKGFPKIKPLDINKFTAESPIKEVIDVWIEEITNSILSKKGEEVDKEVRFSIFPW